MVEVAAQMMRYHEGTHLVPLSRPYFHRELVKANFVYMRSISNLGVYLASLFHATRLEASNVTDALR